MKLSFLIAGAQKGGTTALYSYLDKHPRLCMPRVKETHFFDAERRFAGKSIDYGPLHAHFDAQPGQLTGEATPVTMYWHDAPRRVWKYNPAMKLICILRNPIERAYSHWNMERQRGVEKLPFIEAIKAERDRCRLALPLQHRIYSYVDRGYYSEQIRRLWRFFPPTQTMFIRSEALRTTPQATLDTVFDFLGVDRLPINDHVVHARRYPSPMSDSARNLLGDLYRHEIQELGRMLNWECDGWLRPEAAPETQGSATDASGH